MSASEVVSDKDLVAYQKDVWSDSSIAGYMEVCDFSALERVDFSLGDALDKIAKLASSMDVPGKHSRFAIVATQPLHFGLARMYQSYRAMHGGGESKDVEVFKTREEALKWLEIDANWDDVKPGPAESDRSA